MNRLFLGLGVLFVFLGSTPSFAVSTAQFCHCRIKANPGNTLGTYHGMTTALLSSSATNGQYRDFLKANCPSACISNRPTANWNNAWLCSKVGNGKKVDIEWQQTDQPPTAAMVATFGLPGLFELATGLSLSGWYYKANYSLTTSCSSGGGSAGGPSGGGVQPL